MSEFVVAVDSIIIVLQYIYYRPKFNWMTQYFYYPQFNLGNILKLNFEQKPTMSIVKNISF